MSRRQKLVERKQRKARAKGTPPPAEQTCLSPADAAWELFAKRFRATFHHPPSRDPHAGKLVADAYHDGTYPPEGERVDGRLVVRSEPPPTWVGRIDEDPYTTEGE